MLVPVCETKYRKYNVSDALPNCNVTVQKVCFDEVVNGKTKQVCRDVPKTWCGINNTTVMKTFPETEVYQYISF